MSHATSEILTLLLAGWHSAEFNIGGHTHTPSIGTKNSLISRTSGLQNPIFIWTTSSKHVTLIPVTVVMLIDSLASLGLSAPPCSATRPQGGRRNSRHSSFDVVVDSFGWLSDSLLS